MCPVASSTGFKRKTLTYDTFTHLSAGDELKTRSSSRFIEHSIATSYSHSSHVHLSANNSAAACPDNSTDAVKSLPLTTSVRTDQPQWASHSSPLFRQPLIDDVTRCLHLPRSLAESVAVLIFIIIIIIFISQLNIK